MATKDESKSLLASIHSSKWYASITAWLFGVVVVVFLSLLGGAISSSTELIEISGQLITSVRMASIGLGTGFYLGSSIRHQESGKSWFLFGVFTALSVLAYFTTDGVILGQFPVYSLLVAGGVLTVIAHITPMVNENEEILQLLKYIAGYLSSMIVVIIASSKYLLSAVVFCWGWFKNLSPIEKVFIITIILLVVVVYHNISKEINERKVNQRAKEKAESELSMLLSRENEDWNEMDAKVKDETLDDLVDKMDFGHDSQETRE